MVTRPGGMAKAAKGAKRDRNWDSSLPPSLNLHRMGKERKGHLHTLSPRRAAETLVATGTHGSLFGPS